VSLIALTVGIAVPNATWATSTLDDRLSLRNEGGLADNGDLLFSEYAASLDCMRAGHAPAGIEATASS
jgi:hypothetical protein